MYISGVPKVVKKRKKEKTRELPVFQRSSKEYKKKRTRMFSAEWQVGRPWLQHDHNKGMICE